MSTEPSFYTLERNISHTWHTSALPSICDYIRIPNQSPGFDENWQSNGLLRQAMDTMVRWVENQSLSHVVQCIIHEEPGRTPFFLLELNDTPESMSASPVLIYGHMDKQPPVTGWKEGAGPYDPLYEISTGKLYGRGAADDGYALYSAVTAIRALQQHNAPHGKVFITIEGGEESGSVDLPYYFEKFLPESRQLSLILCLDSGGHSYDRLWVTDSLRGVTEGLLRVETMTSPIHSGLGGGIIPCPFRIARTLLDRVEDATTGEIKIPELHSVIPTEVLSRCAQVDAHLETGEYLKQFSCEGLNVSWPKKEILPSVSSLILQNAWKPCLTVTGIDGFPATRVAGNVIHPEAAYKLSMRLPPTIDHHEATKHMKRVLESDPPYNSRVSFTMNDGGNGWAAKPFAQWLRQAVEEASMAHFGQSVGSMSLGGSIPLVNSLQNLSPSAEVVVTGVLGPESNAHGPNEFLHVPYVKKLTSCVAHIIREHFIAISR